MLTPCWPSLAVVDTHPTSLVSLRLDQPFPALLAYSDSIDYAALDSMDHGNVPFVLILIRALQEWRASHDGKQPVWSGKLSQKKDFLATITSARRHGDEENYAEAEEKAFLAAQVTKVSRPSPAGKSSVRRRATDACLPRLYS